MPGNAPSADDTAHYRDDGCSFHPTCLTCPLPQCRYDMGDDKRDGALEKAWQVLQMEKEGLTAVEMARRLDTSRRTIFRLKHYFDPNYGSQGNHLNIRRD